MRSLEGWQCLKDDNEWENLRREKKHTRQNNVRLLYLHTPCCIEKHFFSNTWGIKSLFQIVKHHWRCMCFVLHWKFWIKNHYLTTCGSYPTLHKPQKNKNHNSKTWSFQLKLLSTFIFFISPNTCIFLTCCMFPKGLWRL